MYLVGFLRLAQVDASGLLGLTIGLEADGLGGDEAGRVGGLEVGERVHAGELLAVELAGLGAAAEDAREALVAAESDLAVDVVLGGEDALLDELALGREVEAVVEKLGPGEGDELVTELANLTVEDETLEVKMGEAEDGHGGGVTSRVRMGNPCVEHEWLGSRCLTSNHAAG